MFLPFQVEADETFEPVQSRPLVTWSLLGLCTAVHAALLFLAPTDTAVDDVFFRFGLVKVDLHWWMPITCTVLHAPGLLHLASNGYFLWIYGSHLERYLGSRGYLLLYALGGIASSGVHLLTIGPLRGDVPTVGASGAISAVLGAFLVLLPTARLRSLFFSMLSFRPVVVVIPAWVVLGLWFGGQLIYTLQLVGAVEGVALWAHLGGFTAGAVLGTWIHSRQTREQEAETPETQTREVMQAAWNAQHPLADDQAALDLVQAAADLPASTGNRGTARLLHGLAAGRLAGDAEQALADLVLAFRQAKDYGDRAKAATAYLQTRALFAPADVPADLHRDGGFLLAAAGHAQLALAAFRDAAAGGASDPGGRMRDSAAALLESRCGRADLAARVRGLPPETSPATPGPVA